ncbi:MAG: hypothetical protein ACI89X_002620 [Planctomycetota bacterium]|jgi:hypothetical protein
MNGYLELADGAFIGVRDGLVLGRVATCDVVVDDTKASRRHARLVVEAGVVEIEDMNSSNGTLLNGKPVDRRLIRDGDEVRIGKTVIIYREGALPGAKSASRSSGVAASIFDDEDDLFGDSPSSSATISDEPRSSAPAPKAPEPELIQPKPKSKPAPPKPESPKPAPPKPAPKPAAPSASDDLLGGDDLFGDDDVAAAPPPAKPAPTNVVEFDDEVVEAQKAPAPTRREPEPVRRREEPVIEVRKSQPAVAPSGSTKAAAGDEVVGSSQRVLQFSKKASGKNPLGDDVGQMSGGMRMLVVLAAVAAGGGIVYGITIAMQ